MDVVGTQGDSPSRLRGWTQVPSAAAAQHTGNQLAQELAEQPVRVRRIRIQLHGLSGHDDARPRRLLHQLIIMVVVSRLKHPVLTKRQAQVGLEALPVRRLTPNGVRGAAKGFDVAPVSSAARLPEGRIVSERSQSMSARGQEPEAPSEAVRQHRL